MDPCPTVCVLCAREPPCDGFKRDLGGQNDKSAYFFTNKSSETIEDKHIVTKED